MYLKGGRSKRERRIADLPECSPGIRGDARGTVRRLRPFIEFIHSRASFARLTEQLVGHVLSTFRHEKRGGGRAGVPQQEILPTIRKVIEGAKEIPFSDQGGAWARTGKEGYGSYLMNFGTLTEETVDEWIETCKRLGFTQVDNHGGGSFFEFGTFELNKQKWPDGWESFKRINRRLHDAGISSIFHTYAFSSIKDPLRHSRSQ
jgi:hypothetical protein